MRSGNWRKEFSVLHSTIASDKVVSRHRLPTLVVMLRRSGIIEVLAYTITSHLKWISDILEKVTKPTRAGTATNWLACRIERDCYGL